MSEVEQRREQLPTRTGMSEVEQRREQLPNARAAKIRRSAWLFAGLAAFFYLGYIAWMILKAQL